LAYCSACGSPKRIIFLIWVASFTHSRNRPNLKWKPKSFIFLCNFVHYRCFWAFENKGLFCSALYLAAQITPALKKLGSLAIRMTEMSSITLLFKWASVWVVSLGDWLVICTVRTS
jgi:hypothetical protein